MTEPIISQRGPFVQKVEPGTYWWCACGRSKAQPFCDGSHKGTGLGPTQVEITEAKVVAWCGCKHSKNMPFCDGSHSGLKA
jgi:CDGSH-type Zn-finger protein